MNNIIFDTDEDYVYDDWQGGFTKKEKEIINNYSIEPILHLFSGNSEIGDAKIDINPDSKASIIDNVFNYIETCKESFKTILLDPIFCSEQRQQIWKEKYGNLKDLYIFPYDTRRTKLLWDFFLRIHPLRIIIKSLSFYTIPEYNLKQGYCLYPGAFKPCRCIAIYQSKNHSLII